MEIFYKEARDFNWPRSIKNYSFTTCVGSRNINYWPESNSKYSVCPRRAEECLPVAGIAECPWGGDWGGRKQEEERTQS